MLLTLPPGLADAQITVTNSVFPVAGDRLYYAIDNNPGPQITITPPGVFQHWDFSSLQRSASWQTVMRPAATGAVAARFPDATLVYSLGGHAMVPNLPGSNASEAYLKVTDSQVQVLGFAGGSDPFESGLNLPYLDQVIAYSPPLEIQRAPVNFFDVSAASTGALIPYPLSALPQLEVIPGDFTEYRGRITVQMTSIVDGAGTLTIPGGSFEALRVKTVYEEEIGLDGYAILPGGSPLGWLDITDITANMGLVPRIGIQSYYHYEFIDAHSKEVLATVNCRLVQDINPLADPLAVATVQFKDLTVQPGADFDADGRVDGADFLIWQRGFGTTSGALAQGDASGNGVVDAADLEIWRQQAGAPAAQLVPEPTAAALWLAGAAIVLARRQRR